MKEVSKEGFLADIDSLEKELKKHLAKIEGRITTLQKKRASYETKLSDAIKSRDNTKSEELSNNISQNNEEITYYKKSLEFLELKLRIVHAVGVNFSDEYTINPKLATTNALEKLREFEDAIQEYKDSVNSKDIIGSAVVLLERCKLMNLKYQKHGVEYTPIKVGAERGQKVEPVLQLKKEDIKFMTFSGGGAKGTAYGGVLQALDENGLLPNIEAVAGSSAGSMMAAFTAAGVSVASTLELLQGLTKEVIEKNLGKYVEEGIRASIVNYIYFESCKPNKFTGRIDQLVQANPNIPIKTLETLANIYVELTTGGPVTFGMIAHMREIDPKRFKHLHITATNTTKNQLQIFSSENLSDANISVSKACMASSALPVFRPEETINGQKYKDGGILDNNPRDCFKSKKGRALAFYFPTASHDQALKGREEYTGEKGYKWKLEKLVTKSTVTGFKRSGDLHELAVEKQFYDILNNPLETIIIDTGSVGTIDFKKGTKLMNYLLIKGEIQTQRYLNNVVTDIEPDFTLDFRSVMLKAVEISMKQKSIPEVSKVKFHVKPVTFKTAEEKLPLLTYCTKEKWADAFASIATGEIEEVVAYVMKDCFRDLTISKQHKLAKILAEVLNDTECPLTVKESFIKGLNLARTQDMPALSNEPISPAEKVAKHQVRADDFEAFIIALNQSSGRGI